MYQYGEDRLASLDLDTNPNQQGHSRDQLRNEENQHSSGGGLLGLGLGLVLGLGLGFVFG